MTTAGGTKMAQQKRLFDCVLVVGVNAVKAASGSDASKNPPYVKFHFPYPPSFMKAVTQFCFPDSCLDKMKSKQEEIFSFALTEANGEKRWGYCHRVFPQCFCIVSYLPCFSIFSKILKKVIKLHQNAPPGTTPPPSSSLSLSPSFSACVWRAHLVCACARARVRW